MTGSRADYGLLYHLINQLERDPDITLQLVATGMHLSQAFGLTVNQIRDDGFTVSYEVDSLLSSDTNTGMAKSVGLGVIGFTECYANLKPDLVMLLGDRYEIFAAASAAMLLKIPVGHIHGGEVTEGAIDESIRHCITKMSHLHLTSNNLHRDRVIQMGENPEFVQNFGAPGVEAFHRLAPMTRQELEASLGFKFYPKNLLVTFHPVTLSQRSGVDEVETLWRSLAKFEDCGVIITKSNSDPSGRAINDSIDDYAAQSGGRVKAFTSLGQRRYFSLLRQMSAMVGNSSSGLIEAPSVPVPTVNIGDRQKGRLAGNSVIHCPMDEASIVKAIRKAIDPPFKNQLRSEDSPYGNGGFSVKVVDLLKSIDLERLNRKPFFNHP